MLEYNTMIKITHRTHTMNTLDLLSYAEAQAVSCFSGMAVDCEKSTIHGSTVVCEKVWKFNRAALKATTQQSVVAVNPRLIGDFDGMITKVGKPGSVERVQALAFQYAIMNEKESPFKDE